MTWKKLASVKSVCLEYTEINNIENLFSKAYNTTHILWVYIYVLYAIENKFLKQKLVNAGKYILFRK